MKYTPGPWEFSDMSGLTMDDKPYASAHVGANQEIVAILGDDYEKRDTVLANAQLIAAAPKLLEALEEMLAEMQVWESELGEHPAATKARAVLAKAKGETP